jgi:hypothetical protein
VNRILGRRHSGLDGEDFCAITETYVKKEQNNGKKFEKGLVLSCIFVYNP